MAEPDDRSGNLALPDRQLQARRRPSFSNHLTGRDLLTPDEIMQMPPELQLLRVQGQPSALAQKLRYYADPEFKGLFVPQDQ